VTNDATKEIKKAAQTFYDTVVDVTFWETMQFAVDVCVPLVRALRLMDTSTVKAHHAYAIWEMLGLRLVEVLSGAKCKDADTVTKLKIVDIYESHMEAACCPVVMLRTC
jgi:hypothetical protein